MNSVLVRGTELFDDSAPIAIAVGVPSHCYEQFFRLLPGIPRVNVSTNRWDIETLFGMSKTRGLNLKSTHLNQQFYSAF